MKLDKTEIARRQLGTALALFLQDCDPVSVHALACAGCEIAEHLTRKAGEEPFSTHALLTFPDLDIGKIRRLKNQYWNAFKTAYAARLGVQVPMNAPCRYTLGLGYASLFPRSVCTG